MSCRECAVLSKALSARVKVENELWLMEMLMDRDVCGECWAPVGLCTCFNIDTHARWCNHCKNHVDLKTHQGIPGDTLARFKTLFGESYV